MKKIGILAFTDNGKALALKARKCLEGAYAVDLFHNQMSPKDYLKESFDKKDIFLFISAAGIAVRMIVPYIKSKDIDPAVIVMDEMGNYIVPILSGHLGGGNEAAIEIGQLLGATPVITTATDINSKFAVDNWAKAMNCTIVDISKIKEISSAILKGQDVGFKSDFVILGSLPDELTFDPAPLGIHITFDEDKKPFENTFTVIPKAVTLGVGCKKNTDTSHFEEEVLRILRENKVSIRAIEKVASIDIKKDEKCIIAFCKKYKLPFHTYSADELTQAEGTYPNSEFVKSVTGVDNVCQRSCKLGSGNGKIILSKTCGSGVTVALAMKDWKCKF